jgi:hypothetical protein
MKYDFTSFSGNIVLVDNSKSFDSAYNINIAPESIIIESDFTLIKRGVMAYPDPVPDFKGSKNRIINLQINGDQFTLEITKLQHTVDGFSEYLLFSPSHNTAMLLRPNVLAKNIKRAQADLQYCGMYFILSSVGYSVIASTQDRQIIESIRTFRDLNL